MTLRMYFACCAVAILIVDLSEAQLVTGYVAPYYTIPAYVNPGFTTYHQASPVQTRSTDKITSESEKSTNSNAQLDEEISTADNPAAVNNDHQPKPRSPDNNDADDLDFLTKAANPVVETEPKIGSMFHKVGQELKHVMHKIESGIHPHHSEDHEKSAKNEDENDYIPYKVWSKTSDHNDNSYGNQEVKSVADIMNNYYRAMNNGRNMQIPEHVIQEKLSPALKSAMDAFQQSLSQSSVMQNNNSPYGKNLDNGNNNYHNSPYGSSYNNAANPMEKIGNSAVKFSDNTAEDLSKQFRNEKFQQNYHPMVSMPDPGKSKNESSKSNQNPFYKFYEHAFDWSNNRASHGMNRGQNDNNPLLGSPYDPSYSMYQARYNPNVGMWNAATGMAGQPENAGMNAGYYRQSFNPYNSGFGGNYYQQYTGGDIAGHKYFTGSDLSSQQAQDASGYVSQVRNYRGVIPLVRPLGGVLGSPLGSPLGTLALLTRPTSPLLLRPGGLLPQLARPKPLGPQVGSSAQDITASAMRLAEGIIRGNSEKISKAGVGLGSEIATTATRGGSTLGGPRLFMKRDSHIENIWNSASGLAGSIANAASNPDRGGDQILGSVGSIWNSANNLASDIRNAASNPGYNNYPFVSSTNNPSQIPKTDSPSSIWNSATDLAGNIAKAGNGQTNNPLGTIWNSANNLASNIRNAASNPSYNNYPFISSTYNPSQIPQTNSPSSIWNSATDLAGNIAKAGNGQTNNPLGTIWNSANNLASNIHNAASNPSYNNYPFISSTNNPSQIPKTDSPSSIWNSATDLAGNIAKAGNGHTNNPLGTIWNSADNLVSKIRNAASNPSYNNYPFISSTYNPSQISQTNSPSSIWNSATDLAGNIAKAGNGQTSNPVEPIWNSASNLADNIMNLRNRWNSAAVNPMGSYGNNQYLQSYGPYYAGGYYPRSNLVGSISDSAHQLARNVVNTVNNPAQSSHMVSSPYGDYGNSYYAPLKNVWNSATNLASGISNAATGLGYY